MQTNYDALNTAMQTITPGLVSQTPAKAVERVQPQQTARRSTCLRAALLGAIVGGAA